MTYFPPLAAIYEHSGAISTLRDYIYEVIYYREPAVTSLMKNRMAQIALYVVVNRMSNHPQWGTTV